jgi:hypothetical protein
VSIAVLVFLIIAVAIALFGLAFVWLGMSSERAYWFQRDPHGDPAHEATPFSGVAKRAFSIAFSDTRAPLRIAAIGVIMLWCAAISLVLAGLLSLVK